MSFGHLLQTGNLGDGGSENDIKLPFSALTAE
jgi:hypothetical protein